MRRAAALAAVASALALSNACPGSASAAPRAAPTAPAITLVSQDAWDVAGTSIHLRLDVPEALAGPGASIRLVAYQAVGTRATFDRIAAGGVPGSVLDQVVIPVSTLPTDAGATRSVTVALEGAGAAPDPNRLSLRRSGVYPLVVEVRDRDDRTQSKFTTMAVVVGAGPDGAPQPLPKRLGVGWVWPLTAGPSTLPDGSQDTVVTAALRPNGRLGRQAAALTGAGDVPLTLVPGPETLKSWVDQGKDDAAIGRGAAAVLDASGRSQMVAGTYVPTDLPSLLASGLNSAVDSQIAVGVETLIELLGNRPDTRTALARPVDGASLARLRAGGVNRVIVDDDAVRPGSATKTRPFLLEPPASLASTSPVSAVANDTGIAALLGTDAAPALRAQLVLAALSVLAEGQPDAARAVVVVNPTSLDAPASLFDAMLTGLRGHPWLQPETVDEIFTTIPADAGSADLPRALAPYVPPAPPISAREYLAAQERLAAFRSLAGPDHPIAVAGDRSLLLSESATFSDPTGKARARATIASIPLSIDRFLAQVHVPRPSTITLTSRSGEIPLTFRNDSGQSVDVIVELASPKLAFPEGSSRLVTLKEQSTTVRFAVEARTSGTFPLQLRVRSPDGRLLVADTTFRVRSTVVSTVGIVLIAGAAVFLALWWAIHLRRSRRARRTEALKV